MTELYKSRASTRADGSIPEYYGDAAALGLDGSEKFRVVINYGHEVQFHLVSEEMRAVVTTGLKCRCDDMEGWIAQAKKQGF